MSALLAGNATTCGSSPGHQDFWSPHAYPSTLTHKPFNLQLGTRCVLLFQAKDALHRGFVLLTPYLHINSNQLAMHVTWSLVIIICVMINQSCNAPALVLGSYTRNFMSGWSMLERDGKVSKII